MLSELIYAKSDDSVLKGHAHIGALFPEFGPSCVDIILSKRGMKKTRRDQIMAAIATASSFPQIALAKGGTLHLSKVVVLRQLTSTSTTICAALAESSFGKAQKHIAARAAPAGKDSSAAGHAFGRIWNSRGR